jgi:hypothetical protein
MTNRVADHQDQPPTPQAPIPHIPKPGDEVTVLDLNGFIEVRHRIFPPHVVDGYRLQYPDMAQAIDALMNTVELLLLVQELPVSIVRHNVEKSFLFPQGTMIKVHTPDTVYVGHEFLYTILQVVNLDKAWAALRVATKNLTDMPAEPINIAEAYGLSADGPG